MSDFDDDLYEGMCAFDRLLKNKEFKAVNWLIRKLDLLTMDSHELYMMINYMRLIHKTEGQHLPAGLDFCRRARAALVAIKGEEDTAKLFDKGSWDAFKGVL